MKRKRGSADALAAKWRDICVDSIVEKHPSRSYRQVCRELVQDFDALPIDETLVKPRVGRGWGKSWSSTCLWPTTTWWSCWSARARKRWCRT